MNIFLVGSVSSLSHGEYIKSPICFKFTLEALPKHFKIGRWSLVATVNGIPRDLDRQPRM
jgi:hypothetical protein